MTYFLSVLIAGITSGLIFGTFGFGLVFLYKTTGIANFGLGNIAAFEAFVVYEFYTHGIALGYAVLIAVALSIPFTLGIYFLVMRPKEETSSDTNMLIRTVALYLGLFALMNTIWSSGQPYAFPSILPKGGVRIGNLGIPWADFIIAGIALSLYVGASLVFRYTNLGLKFLAMSDNFSTARLMGLRVTRLSVIGWIFVGTIAMLVGLLVAPIQLLSSDMMDPLLLFGFASSVLGGLTSFSGAFAGGMIIGAISDISTSYIGGSTTLASAFVVLLIVLSVRPSGLFGSGSLERL